jgi:GT2 family glycosyltransferase
MSERHVSVIVPAHNAGEDVAHLLAALRRQTLPRDQFEIVIADDGSTDGATDGIATDDGWIRVLPGPRMSSYAARDRAVAGSRAPILAFTDADCRPDAGWLEAAQARLEDADVIAGLVRFRVPVRPTLWTLLDMDTFLDQERQVQVGLAVTANLTLRRELFDAVGGFDVNDSFAPGDQDFVGRCVAAGARLVFAPEAAVEHPTRDECKAYLNKVWGMNRGYGEFETLHGRRPYCIRPAAWVPMIATLRARRRHRRTVVGLDRHRFAASGLRPRLRDDLRALPMIYVVQPYIVSLAQLNGWLRRRAQLILKSSEPGSLRDRGYEPPGRGFA